MAFLYKCNNWKIDKVENMTNKQTNNKSDDTTKEIRINMTIENMAFMQLICTSKGINKNNYINNLIENEIKKSNLNLSNIMANLEKL